jgi:zinc transport system substrate-binding protein
METYVAKIIQQEKKSADGKTHVITAMQSNGLKLFSKRNNQHPLNHTQTNIPVDITINQKNIDPHIWLSIYNATAISKHIAQSLISLDPKNAVTYQNNLQRLLEKIEDTEQQIKQKLNNNPSHKPHAFISYHDAFQYFDRENQLDYVDSISYDEESGPSLKHIHQIKKLIKEKTIRCLVYQPPKPALIDSMTAQTKIQAAALDPMGLKTNNYKDAWFELMLQIAVGFKQCLSP